MRIVDRLEVSRGSRGGFRAKCPAHVDRGFALSINNGADGSALVHCFRGCETSRVLEAIGLKLRDLSPTERPTPDPRIRMKPFAPAEVQSFIIAAAQQHREARLKRNIWDTPNFRSADLNDARRRANIRFRLCLQPIPQFPWEGFSPHDQDLLWPLLFDRAALEVRLQWWGLDPPDAPMSPRMLIRASEIAAKWLRAEAL